MGKNYELPHVLLKEADIVEELPEPVTPPDGLLYDEQMQAAGYLVGSVLHDKSRADRPSILDETNEVHPLRPSSGTGKIIVNIGQRGIYAWMRYIVDLIGLRNAELFVSPGDGYCDTNPPDTTIYSDDIKLMAAKVGGSLVLLNGEATGLYRVVTFRYDNPPEKVNGQWLVNGIPYTWDEWPHMFTTRVNRRITNHITWMTPAELSERSISVTDVPKGDETWPTVTNQDAYIEHEKVMLYPPLGSELTLYKTSLVEGGNLTAPQTGGHITVDAYMFVGSETYARNRNDQEWYLLEEMLVTVVEPYAGKGYDWRCYASLPEQNTPYRGRWGYRIPLCGWQRSSSLWVWILSTIRFLRRTILSFVS